MLPKHTSKVQHQGWLKPKLSDHSEFKNIDDTQRDGPRHIKVCCMICFQFKQESTCPIYFPYLLLLID